MPSRIENKLVKEGLRTFYISDGEYLAYKIERSSGGWITSSYYVHKNGEVIRSAMRGDFNISGRADLELITKMDHLLSELARSLRLKKVLIKKYLK